MRAGWQTATLSQLDTVLEGEAVNGGEGGDFVDGGDFVISEDWVDILEVFLFLESLEFFPSMIAHIFVCFVVYFAFWISNYLASFLHVGTAISAVRFLERYCLPHYSRYVLKNYLYTIFN